MGAGVPSWGGLAAMGKLPAEQEKNLPALAGVNRVNAELNRLREGMCKACHEKLYPPKKGSPSEITQLKCEIEGCGAMVGGQSEDQARMNMKNHISAKHGQ